MFQKTTTATKFCIKNSPPTMNGKNGSFVDSGGLQKKSRQPFTSTEVNLKAYIRKRPESHCEVDGSN